MEHRKKTNPFVVFLLILLCLLLAFCCCVSAGLTNFQPFDFRFGLRLVGDNSQTGALERGEFVLLDQELLLKSGSVVYFPIKDAYYGVAEVSGELVKLMDGTYVKDVAPVHSKLSVLAPAIRFLQDQPLVSYSVTAGYVLLFVLVKLTAPARWRKRQQKLIRKNLESFGAPYAKEEETQEY
jgi:hypothetical protein